jgi:hypothetical protein
LSAGLGPSPVKLLVELSGLPLFLLAGAYCFFGSSGLPAGLNGSVMPPGAISKDPSFDSGAYGAGLTDLSTGLSSLGFGIYSIFSVGSLTGLVSSKFPSS